MAENNPIKTKYGLVEERVRRKHADKEFADEEAIHGQIADDYDDYDKRIAEFEERENTLANMFTSDPRSAAFLMNWRDGDDPAVSLIRQYGNDILEAVNDPERLEAIAAANKEYVERVAENEALEKQYKENFAKSLEQIDAYQSERGWSDEQVDQIMEKLGAILSDGLLGKISMETIDMINKAISHDEDVASAAHEGEVRGRNAKISEKLRKRNASDGTAALDGKSAPARSVEAPSMGALDRYNDGLDDIWSRGGEKRRKY